MVMPVENPWLLESVLANAPLHDDVEIRIAFVPSTGVLEPGSEGAPREGLRAEVGRGELTGPQRSRPVCSRVFAHDLQRVLGHRLWEEYQRGRRHP